MVALTGESSLVVTQKMPKKLNDPGKFTLSIHIGNNEVVQELSDLVASINLMLLSLFNTLAWESLYRAQCYFSWQIGP